MNEMIERVARASFDCWRKRMTEKGRLADVGQTFEDMSESEQEFAKLHARAIVEAMREPTEVMCERGFSAACKHDCGNSAPAIEIAPATWRAMIDAALKDEP